MYFLQILRDVKSALGFELHAYCLMSSHVHLLFREKQLGDISLIMKRLLTKYAMYFNRKYQRSGALIASRYKSVPVEVDEYFIPLQRYIHQNPLKAGLVTKLEDYPFSSYREYIFGGELVNTVLSIGIVGKDEWISLHQAITDEVFEISGQISLTDEEIRRRITSYTHGRQPHEIGSWVRTEWDLLLRKLKEEGLSIRQIERVTGISRGVVAKS
jgi:REP element-mobilizing transposase RayT